MPSDQAPPRPSAEDTQRLNVPAPRGGGRRRMSGPTLIALLAAGAVVGATSGVLFSRWRLAQQEVGTTQAPEPTQPRSLTTLTSPPLPTPELVFSTTKTRPKATPDVLEAGAKEVYCFFTVPGEAPAGEVTMWWVGATREPVRARGQVTKEPGRELRGWVVLKPPGNAKAFASGIYEIALRAGGVPTAEGSFAMLKGSAELLKRPPGMERYRPEVKDVVVFTGRPAARPEKPYVLPAGASRVRATFSYSHALSGTAFTMEWLYEDGLIQQATTEVVIRAAEGRADAWFATKPPRGLPAGKYAVLISMGEGTPPLAQEPFWIGRRPRAEELRKAG